MHSDEANQIKRLRTAALEEYRILRVAEEQRGYTPPPEPAERLTPVRRAS